MKIILLYDGRSEEYNVSALSTYSALNTVYYKHYQVQLAFISKDGQWIKGLLLSERSQNKEALHLTWAQAPEKAGRFSGRRIGPSGIYEEEAIVFPVLHGPNGEDGTIQGFMETVNTPYVGAGVLASANAMDKITTKYLLQTIGTSQVPFVSVLRSDWKGNSKEVFEKCEDSLIYPVFVKSANMGSSIGISKVENREELQEALEEVFRYDVRAIIEQGIEAREIKIAILGDEDVRTTLSGEVVKDAAFYDYDAKYISNTTEMQVPTYVPGEVAHQAQEYAKKAYTMLDGSGLSRCDSFLTSENELSLNELNTMLGFTDFSMYPLLWENMGLKYSGLTEELIQLALNRSR